MEKELNPNYCFLRFEDLPDPKNASGAGAVRDKLYEKGLLVIGSFPLNDELLMTFSRQFGMPDLVSPPEFRAIGCPHIRVQSSVPGVGVSGGGEYWHSDGPWSELPSAVTILLCFEAGVGSGQTLFVDMRSVFDNLPKHHQRELATRMGCYPCRAIYERELSYMGIADQEKLAELHDLIHPIVRSHPVTGRKALYLNEKWLSAIENMTPDESRLRLAELYKISSSDASLYTHSWKTGDLLVWDNASMMHKALPTEPGSIKTTHRVTIAGF